MRSERFSLYFGGVGAGTCSLGAALMSATVRGTTVWDPMAVPLASSAEVVIFGSFKRRARSFRVAGVALRDIPTCYVKSRSV